MSMTHCRSFYRRHDHKRSVYLWCKVQSVQCSSWMIRICLLLWLARSTILHSRFVTEISSTYATLVQPWCFNADFLDHHLSLIENVWCDSIRLYLFFTYHYIHRDEYFQVRENEGESNGSDLARFWILFEFKFRKFGQDLRVIWIWFG